MNIAPNSEIFQFTLPGIITENDAFEHHILPLITPKDLCHLAQVSRQTSIKIEKAWEKKIIDTEENRLFVAQFYFSVTAKVGDFPNVVKQTMNNMFQQMNLPPEELPSDEKMGLLIEKAIFLINKFGIEITAKNFTLFELKELAKFYTTPYGMAILKKSGPMMIDSNIGSLINQAGHEAVKEVFKH